MRFKTTLIHHNPSFHNAMLFIPIACPILTTQLLSSPFQCTSHLLIRLLIRHDSTPSCSFPFLHISIRFVSPPIHDASLLFNTCPLHFHFMLFLHSTLTFPVVHHNSLSPLLFCLPIRHPTMTIFTITVQLFHLIYTSTPLLSSPKQFRSPNLFSIASHYHSQCISASPQHIQSLPHPSYPMPFV